jgi:hypothetical protein
MARVMLIGLPKRDAHKISSILDDVGVQCDTVPSLENAYERLPADPPTLIITTQPETSEPLSALHANLKVNAPATPFLVVLNRPSTDAALSVMRAGAHECLSYPLKRFAVLAASKRATAAHGRTLFGKRVKEPQTPWFAMVFVALVAVAVYAGISRRWNGPPVSTLNLGSATLSGLQWQGRSLWVGNWVESTVSHYIARKGLFPKQRKLESEEIFRMEDSQPILVCNTPDSLVTVGFDLKLRSHQRAVGLPTVQTVNAPGPSPTGLAWDGENIWSSDNQTGQLYKHGEDLRVVESLNSIIPAPMGLAWDGKKSLWVVGGSPLRAAKLVRQDTGVIWQGPYPLKDFLDEGVPASGIAVGFGRIWAVTGGSPHMVSRSLHDVEEQLEGWK